MAKRDNSLRPFITALRCDGFRKDYDDRSGGGRVVSFKKTVGQREVDVQLWGDGKHRASHFFNGRMSTYPTEFNSIDGMRRAIQTELTRLDHAPRKPAPTAETQGATDSGN